jgi:transcription initiation factor TFIIB
MADDTAAVMPSEHLGDEADESGEQQESPEEQEQAEPEQFTCPECGSTNFSNSEERGELVCDRCGLVIEEDMIDDSQEWRAFSAEEREEKARAGAPITYTKQDMGISTQIGSGASELYKVSGKKRGQYYRLRKWHKRSTQSKDRNLGFALSELKRLVSSLSLPNAVHEEVARLYEKAVDEGLVKGRRIEHIIAALIYIVARNQGTPRTLDEIADASGSEKREIGKAYRYVARELDLRILPSRPEHYLPKFAGELRVSGEVQAHARQIIEDAREHDLLSGKGPTGIAAAALYLAAALEGEKISQKKVADTVGVTEVTIRNRYNEFVNELGLLENGGSGD